jgi:hypothetical protein
MLRLGVFTCVSLLAPQARGPSHAQGREQSVTKGMEGKSSDSVWTLSAPYNQASWMNEGRKNW